MAEFEVKVVLLVYNNGRRPVEFQAVPGNPCVEQKNLYNAVETVFTGILSVGEGSSSSHTNMFYLQFESNKWGGEMVNITRSAVVPSTSIFYLRKPTLNKPKVKVRLLLYS